MTIKELDGLHDSDLLSVLYNTSGDTDWSIKLTIRCPNDSGYVPWDGKLLVLSVIDVASSNYSVWGVAGSETIDHVYPGVSATLREGTMKGRPIGAHFNFEFTIKFISGSILEVICQDIQVEIMP